MDTWNGDLTGYLVEYREVNANASWRSVSIYTPYSIMFIVDKLEFLHTYELRIRAVNALGMSPWSPVVVVYVEMGRSRTLSARGVEEQLVYNTCTAQYHRVDDISDITEY